MAVINRRHKLVFVGLPFSGSSAITKYLTSNHEFKMLGHKHINVPAIKQFYGSKYDFDELKIFLVARHPLEKTKSYFAKFVHNPNEMFTNPKFFIENGGFVKPKARIMRERVVKERLGFEDFLQSTYGQRPYDDELSVNKKFVHAIIPFESLAEGVEKFLQENGIYSASPLPLYNSTKKDDIDFEVSPAVINRIFGPYLSWHKDIFNDSIEGSFASNFLFGLQRPIFDFFKMSYDKKQHQNPFSVKEFSKK